MQEAFALKEEGYAIDFIASKLRMSPEQTQLIFARYKDEISLDEELPQLHEMKVTPGFQMRIFGMNIRLNKIPVSVECYDDYIEIN
jgi:hypothetical protein